METDALRRNPEILWARRLVWLYFWLLLFEGALRKWFLPGYSNPLLLIRDPVVLLIYLLAASRRQFPLNGFIGYSAILAVLLFISALLWGHGNLLVALFGLRANFLHLPLIFIIPRIFSQDDVRAFGKALLWVSLPMAALIILQFMLPARHILNIAVGGTYTQMQASLDHVRPAATFSFVIGATAFLSLQCAFIASAFFEKSSRFLRTLSFIALLFALACSLSRSSVVACLLVLAGAVLVFFLNPSRVKRGLLFISSVVLLGLLASLTPLFQWGSSLMAARFDEADTMGTPTMGIAERIYSELMEPFRILSDVSFTGAGTGAGTNVGTSLLVGQRVFALGEVEWTRLLRESGLILGVALIGLRVALCFYLLYWSYRALKQQGNATPWLLCAAILPWVFSGGWGQPTILGFASLGAGFILAATRPAYQDHPLFRALMRSL